MRNESIIEKRLMIKGELIETGSSQLFALNVEAKKTGKTAFATPFMVMFNGMFVEIVVTGSERKV